MVSHLLGPMSSGCQRRACTLGPGYCLADGLLLLTPVPLLLTVTSLEQSLRSLAMPSDMQELRDSL